MFVSRSSVYSKLFLAFLLLSVRWQIQTLFFPPLKFRSLKMLVTCPLGASAKFPFHGAGSYTPMELVLSRAFDRVEVQIAVSDKSEQPRKIWFKLCLAYARKMPNQSIRESFEMMFSLVPEKRGEECTGTKCETLYKHQHSTILCVHVECTLGPTDQPAEPQSKIRETALMSGFGSNHQTGRTLDECQDMINRSLKKPRVKFLREKMAKAGCTVGDDFFHAVNCEGGVSGGYMRGYGIDVCSNQIAMQDDVNQVIIHELVHAYDDCQTANLEWENCAHHACSEIRAGHLSGDCHFKRELFRIGLHKLRGHGSECVKRRVMKSVMANPHCSEAAAREAMEAVWDTCYNDTRPFKRAP